MHNFSEASIANKRSTSESADKKNKNFLTALRHAIENDELIIDYQPRYDARTGRTDTLEALVRWPRNGIGKIYPAEFIDKAIEIGLIYSLDQSVFKKCCADLIWLRDEIDENIKIAVNISPVECESLHHTQKLIDICHSYGLLMSDFEFEITESTRINDVRKLKAFCDTVIELGAAISLDDFGTCYSPLNNLCDLPVDYIKIDRSFTKKIGYVGRSETLVSHLIILAHEMDIKVVAEGIEHAYQRDQLISMGCDQIQGFYMCKPLDPQLITTSHIKMHKNY
jgi:EAL domain-containing protein (putative c-di-GMP-specific phosphodiesterase class I)